MNYSFQRFEKTTADGFRRAPRTRAENDDERLRRRLQKALPAEKAPENLRERIRLMIREK